MSKWVMLDDDPRYPAFIERYAGDCYRFAVEVVGITPSAQQKQMMDAISHPGARVSVSSGHGTGKSKSISSIVLWHMLCFYDSWTMITANTIDQIKASSLKELGKDIAAIGKGPHGWVAPHIELMGDGDMRIKGRPHSWRMELATANARNANKMAGRHAKRLLIIVDEASSVPDEVMNTLNGALTEQENRMFLTSQPTKSGGFFYDTFHTLSKAHGGSWQNLTLSSLESPHTSDEALADMWRRYDDDERRVRLLGQFPQDTSRLFMGLRDVERCYGLSGVMDGKEWGWVLSCDIASGEGLRDKSVASVCRVWGYGDDRRVEVVRIPMFTNNIRANTVAGYLSEIGSEFPGVTYAVDSGGLGINVCQDLEDMGKNVHRINWGNPCFTSLNKERYMNLRAQATHQMARAAKEGRLQISTVEHKGVLVDQLAHIPKLFSDAGKIKVPAKHGKEWEGRGSPDGADTIAFCFLEGLAYTPASDGQITSSSVAQAAAAAFSDL